MGQRIVGQKEPWLPGCIQLLGIIITGAALMALAFWLLWLEYKP